LQTNNLNPVPAALRGCSGQAPGAEHVPELELTQRVLAETVRLYPPVYVIPRVCTRSVRVGRYAVEAGPTSETCG
jgi:pentalenene oxygenase